MSSRSYVLQIILGHQSLKSIHCRTLLIFQNQKNPTDLRVNTWGGGIKNMLSPHVLTYIPHLTPHPGIYALAEPPSKAYRCDKQIYISEKKYPHLLRTFHTYLFIILTENANFLLPWPSYWCHRIGYHKKNRFEG